HEVARECRGVADQRTVAVPPVAEELVVGEPLATHEEGVQGDAHTGSSAVTPLSDTLALQAVPSHQRYWCRPVGSGCHAAGFPPPAPPPAAAAADAAENDWTGSAPGALTAIFPFENAVPGVFQLTRSPSGGTCTSMALRP